MSHLLKSPAVLRPLYRYTASGQTEAWDEVALESSVRIYLNGELKAELLCLPAGLRELAAGHLAVSGYLSRTASIQDIIVSDDRSAVNVITAGTANRNTDKSRQQEGRACRIHVEKITALAGQLPVISELFRRTGGVHTGGLADTDGHLHFIYEDTGRHNVLDKIYGRCLLDHIDPTDKILLFSGRATARIITKVAAMGVPLIIARGAATNMAVELAHRAGITLVAFARPERCSVYTHRARIISPGEAKLAAINNPLLGNN